MEDKENYLFGFFKLIIMGSVILTSIVFIGQYLTEKLPLIEVKDVVNEEPDKKKSVRVKKRKRIPKKSVKPKNKVKAVANAKKKIVEKKRIVKITIPKKKKRKVTLRVESLKIIQLPGDNIIRITFKLRNRTRGKRIKGRIFVKFIKDGSTFIYPRAGFKDNKPVDIQKGIFYSIRRFRSVEIKIKKGIDLKGFKKVQFLIYEETDGVTLVYDKISKLRVESGDIFKNPF